jgi:hypothetical protein
MVQAQQQLPPVLPLDLQGHLGDVGWWVPNQLEHLIVHLVCNHVVYTLLLLSQCIAIQGFAVTLTPSVFSLPTTHHACTSAQGCSEYGEYAVINSASTQ